MNVTVEILGGAEAEAMLLSIERRALRPTEGLRRSFRALEEGEQALFAGYGGKYVQTGALERSLTEPDAADAVREAHGAEAEFGSSVFYARFQGTEGVGHHAGPSAVLRATQAEADAAGALMLEYVVRGGLL